MENLAYKSKQVGKSHSYFSMIKKSNKEQFDYMMEAGKGDIVKGYYKLLQEITESFEKIQDITLKYKNRSDFARKLVKSGYRKSLGSANSLLMYGIWASQEKLVIFKTLERNLKIIEEFGDKNV